MEPLFLYQKTKLYVANPPITFSIKRMTRSNVSLRLQFWGKVEIIWPDHKKPPRECSVFITTRKVGDTLKLKYKDKGYSIHIDDIHKELPHDHPNAVNRNYVSLRLVENPVVGEETADV